jgi:TolB-like protein
MVSGQRPLESGVLKGVPRAWASALGRALDPDPEQRPAHPRELTTSLEGGKRRRRLLEVAASFALLLVLAGGAMAWRRAATSRMADRRFIAVLPLANLGGSPDDDYFGDGLAEDINTQLTKVHALRVISRNSTRPFKGTHRPSREIAQELGVGTLLEGTVRRAGGRMRITAQLVDARTDQQLWAETYDRDIRDVLDVQTDVASKVAAALALQLTAAEGARLHRGATSSPSTMTLRSPARAGSTLRPQETSVVASTAASAPSSASFFSVARRPGSKVSRVRLAMGRHLRLPRRGERAALHIARHPHPKQ